MLQGIGFSVYNTGISKVYTQQNKGLTQAVDRLTTGLKINKAADDSAGMSISETLRSSIRGYEVAEKNIGDAVSLVRTAESGLSSISSNLQDIRALVVQAGNSSLSGTEKQALQDEINQKLDNIDDISSGTSFNGKSLLNGTSGTLSIQTGSDAGDTSAVNLSGNFSSSASTSTGNINEGNIGGSAGVALNNINVVTGDLDDILAGVDNALDNVSAAESTMGAKENAFTANLEGLSVQKEEALTARSRVMDSNYAAEASNAIQRHLLRSLVLRL
jgi:flagellin